MPTFKSHRGVTWNYSCLGEGEVILFIHGFAGSSKWWFNQIDALKAHHHVIAIDLPGHGQTSWAPISLVEIAVDIRQLMRHLGIEQFNVVASSMGGLLAMELYRQIPNEIMRMSLVGSLPKLAQAPGYLAGLDVVKIQKLSNQFDGDVKPVLDMFFRSLFTMKERASNEFRAIRAMREGEVIPNRDALKFFLNVIETYDLRDRIASIICPLQFVRGKEDYICTQAALDWVSEHTYNARFDVIDHCGHLPFMTDIKEYNRMLEDFLLS